jgi:hypothetical protein
MNFCSQCGNALPLNSKFCPHCGEKIELVEIGNSKSSSQIPNSVKEIIDNSSPENDLIIEKRSGKIDFSEKDNFIICKDNLRYFGELKNNQRDGFGIYFAYNSGNNFLKEYEGEWERNFFKGKGIQYHYPGYVLREGYFDQRENYFKGKYNNPLFAQGAEVIGVRLNYEGEMSVNSEIRNSIVTKPYNEYVAKEDFIGAYYCLSFSMLPNGYGISYYEDGTIEYQGYWKNGEPNGQGLYHYFDEKKGGTISSHLLDCLDSTIIEGEFEDGILIGAGKVTTDDGTVYEGEFEYGILIGRGKITTLDGTVYEGEFDEDKLNGSGKINFISGLIFEGDFLDGELDGKGKITFLSGDIYEGGFKRGEKHGNGKYTTKEGSYEGNWQLNLPEGNFIFTNKEGDKINGYFKIEDNQSLTFISNTSTASASPIPPRDGAGLR